MVAHVGAEGERTGVALAGFLFGATGMFATMYATQAILPELARDFGTSDATAGLSLTVLVLCVAVGGLLWGPLSDRIGRRRSLVLASSLLVAPVLGAALAPTFGLLLAARALQGLCMPGLMTVGLPYVMEQFGERIGARVMGYYVMSLIVGGLLGRVGVALVADLAGWRVALGLLAFFPLAATVILRRVLPVEPARVPVHTAPTGAVLRTITNRKLLLPTFAGSAGIFAFVGVFTFIGFRLDEPPFSYGQAATGMVYLLWLLGFTAPVAARLVERLGWRRVVVIALGTAVPGILISLVDHIVPVVAGLALLAVGGFALAPATQIGVSESTEADRGLASAVYYSSYYLCSGLGAFVPGIVWERAGWGGVTALCAGVMAVPLLVVGAALSPRRAPSASDARW